MNERIKELAAQAAFRQFTMPKTNVSSALEGYNGMFTEQEAIEKFAELIVMECFKAAMIESKGHMNPIDLMKRMKERVGVEE